MTHSIEMRYFCARPQTEIWLKIPVRVIFFFRFWDLCKNIIIYVFKYTVKVLDQKLKWCDLKQNLARFAVNQMINHKLWKPISSLHVILSIPWRSNGHNFASDFKISITIINGWIMWYFNEISRTQFWPCAQKSLILTA